MNPLKEVRSILGAYKEETIVELDYIMDHYLDEISHNCLKNKRSDLTRRFWRIFYPEDDGCSYFIKLGASPTDPDWISDKREIITTYVGSIGHRGDFMRLLKRLDLGMKFQILLDELGAKMGYQGDIRFKVVPHGTSTKDELRASLEPVCMLFKNYVEIFDDLGLKLESDQPF